VYHPYTVYIRHRSGDPEVACQRFPRASAATRLNDCAALVPGALPDLGHPSPFSSRAQGAGSPSVVQTSVGDSSPYHRTIGDASDVVVVSALRSPLTKARRGLLKDTTADELLAQGKRAGTASPRGAFHDLCARSRQRRPGPRLVRSGNARSPRNQ